VKFASRFVDRSCSLIVCRPSCFVRVIFKGYLPFHGESELNSRVDYGAVRAGDLPHGQTGSRKGATAADFREASA